MDINATYNLTPPTLQNSQSTDLQVDTNGNLKVTGTIADTNTTPASAGVTTSVASSATAVTIKAANAARKALTIANDSTAILYILLGTGTVSATNYTYAIPAKGTTAITQVITGFTGIVTGLWASANGTALVTELT